MKIKLGAIFLDSIRCVDRFQFIGILYEICFLAGYL